jgi:hypothetical protein
LLAELVPDLYTAPLSTKIGNSPAWAGVLAGFSVDLKDYLLIVANPNTHSHTITNLLENVNNARIDRIMIRPDAG